MQPTPIDTAWLEYGEGQVSPIRGACFIGRSGTSSLMLKDDRVSRRHAIIQAQGAEHWLLDLGSANGTYLNGRRLTQAHRLADNDSIKIGGFTLVFHQAGARSSDGSATLTEKTVQEIKTHACWLLVADIEGSTEFARRLPPEEVSRVTGRWLSDSKQIVDENGGTVNKFLGDGFLAYWVDGADAAAAVTKALDRFTQLQQNEAPRFRIVVHFGSVVMGGAASMGEESLMGPAVNFVFRAEKVASRLGLRRMLSEPARNVLQSLLSTTDEGRHPVPSFEGEFAFFSY